MSYLEDDLKVALKRKEPPAGFAEQVLARLAAPAQAKPSWWRELAVVFQPPRLQWVAVSVIASILIPMAAVEYRSQRRARAEGEMAKERLVLAVRIAGSKLHRVQQRVRDISRTEHRI
jgi:hypothetical protein